MKKKKIIKLEINKEDILNLSQDESQKIIGGGGGNVVTVDLSQCPGNACDETERCNTNDCTDEDCTYGGCTVNDTDDTGCITDITQDGSGLCDDRT
ncbi:class I lanthipeptide [Chryseobacterium paridis]|uniref:Class I lanthipeptide n=1 Tax=Chryseobacterium paridis TaxID=2800328 RepID=A0ABS1FPW1_9FLAO|nr:class I lanthipeptide [Chryseobacterium paridis]MBK1894470.1 class I lanthipeptide [Chryseobacterium paridis]